MPTHVTLIRVQSTWKRKLSYHVYVRNRVDNFDVQKIGGFDTEARSVTGKGCDVKKCSLTACNFC